ncbi:MAG: MotA/TolQ/ExbB proton channel family protein [Treponema sp.]|nr:MotA/TolQ/ExbB proton channel family protein [Treponema sp.]
MKLIEFINLGGPLNWLLSAILCFCFCQCLERGIYFFQTRKGSKGDVLKRLQTKALELATFPEVQQRKEMEKETALVYYEMNRGLWLLNFISAVSPSIGLLGTVTGLIGSFSKMAEVGAAVNIQDLSGGIWEAMLTTAFGLIISIPALLCYRTFRRIIEKRMMTISLYGEECQNVSPRQRGVS